MPKLQTMSLAAPTSANWGNTEQQQETKAGIVTSRGHVGSGRVIWLQN